MPTSITTAPGLTMSAVTNFAWPMATIRMSAARVTAGRSRVRLWQTVTVASPPWPRCMSMIAIGLPTMSLRPTHHHVGPGDRDVVAQQQLLDAVRRAGQEPRPALHDPAHVLGMEGVDVLQRIDGLEHPRLVDLLRQRQLHQDAVDRRVAVQPVDQGRAARRSVVSAGGRWSWLVDAGLLAGLLLVAHVDLAGRILAHQHGRQTGRHAGLAR